MWRTALKPKWVGVFLLAGGVSILFVFLGQWQLERAVGQAAVVERDTERVVPLSHVAVPQRIITSDASGRLVSVFCNFSEGDDIVIQDRQMPSGSGEWLIRHCVTPEDHSLAVAAGFIERGLISGATAVESGRFVGRYVPTESPQQSNFTDGENSSVAVADLINRWSVVGPVYGGYLVLVEALPGLSTIVTEPPQPETRLSILNLFYAAQWAIFAMFSLFIWWRLVRDDWEASMQPVSARASKLNT